MLIFSTTNEGAKINMRYPGYDIASKLDAFARRSGFIEPTAYYIVGEFNLKERNGKSVYSDEAHLWCRECAEKLLKKARRLMPKDRREDHFICATDADCEDSCPHCMACGETLRGTVSSYCVEEELSHYTENPITPDSKVNPRQAVELAMVMRAAGDDEEVLAIGNAALIAIARAEAA